MRVPQIVFCAPIAVFASAVSGYPCSRTAPIPAPEVLVERAAVIVVATTTPNVLPDLVGFHVTETLKGTVSTPLLTIEGQLTERESEDENDSPFPFAFVRRGGRHGNCFATTYRAGQSYLLMLRPTATVSTRPRNALASELTPYWEPLAATNERVDGVSDRWVMWVRSHL